MVFKKTISCIFLCIILLLSCVTSNSSSNSEPNIPRQVNSNVEQSMSEIMQKLSGVFVKGTGNNKTVIVMTGNFFNNPSTEPLFLLNGVPYSNDFQSVQNGINPLDVESVQVYKTPAELSFFGFRGAYGVINIKLK